MVEAIDDPRVIDRLIDIGRIADTNGQSVRRAIGRAVAARFSDLPAEERKALRQLAYRLYSAQKDDSRATPTWAQGAVFDRLRERQKYLSERQKGTQQTRNRTGVIQSDGDAQGTAVASRPRCPAVLVESSSWGCVGMEIEQADDGTVRIIGRMDREAAVRLLDTLLLEQGTRIVTNRVGRGLGT